MANSEQLAILKQGVEVWNQWREENQDIEIDLSYADLIGINLSGIDLSRAVLTKANLSNTFLDGSSLNEAILIQADLSRADLSYANLIYANLNKANLSYVTLMMAHLGQADLENANCSYADCGDTDFADANLRNTDFKNACFTHAYLNGANCRNAKFCNVELRFVQALWTNFERANLTGACIEDWHINSRTNLEGIICDFVYQKSEVQDGKSIFLDRLPHDPNRNFEPGEFTRLFQQALETVNLIFNDGIDWKAFLESFQGLQIEAESSELGIQAIEKKRDGSFVVKVDVPASFDKGEIEKAFFRKYRKALKANTAKYRQLLQAKDEEIKAKDTEIIRLYREKSTDLMEIVKLQASQPIINQANSMSQGNINQSGSFGVGVNQGEISGNAKVAGTLNEAQRQDLAEATKEIQSILNQLEETYPTETVPQQVEVANQALKRIEQTPTLKRKLLSAGEEAGIAAIEKALDNPAGVFLTTFLKSMLEAERKK